MNFHLLPEREEGGVNQTFRALTLTCFKPKVPLLCVTLGFPTITTRGQGPGGAILAPDRILVGNMPTGLLPQVTAQLYITATQGILGGPTAKRSSYGTQRSFNFSSLSF